MDSNPLLPIHVEHVVPSHATEVSTTGYDPSLMSDSDISVTIDSGDIPFANVAITDVENVASVEVKSLKGF